MHENMDVHQKKKGKLKPNLFFIMIGFMSRKSVKLSGLGFFTFTNEGFKNVKKILFKESVSNNKKIFI